MDRVVWEMDDDHGALKCITCKWSLPSDVVDPGVDTEDVAVAETLPFVVTPLFKRLDVDPVIAEDAVRPVKSANMAPFEFIETYGGSENEFLKFKNLHVF